MNYTSVEKEKMQRAFAIAHRASEHRTMPTKWRNEFHQIATLLWKADGNKGPIPEGYGHEILLILELGV